MKTKTSKNVPRLKGLPRRKKPPCVLSEHSVSHLVPVIYSISPSSRFHCLSQPGLETVGPHAKLVVKIVG